MKNRAKLTIFLGVMALPALGSASIIPVYLPSPVPVSGGNYAFNYQADLQQDERLDPAATNGITCPGPNNTLTQCNPAGTFFTIYDVGNYVSASAPAGWMVTSQLLGVTPSTINGASFDSPSATNVTFFYTGPVLSANGSVMDISGFQIVSASNTTEGGTFTGQATKDAGTNAGNTDQFSGAVDVPSPGVGAEGGVPEPATFVLLGGGLVGLAILGRNSRV